MEHLIADSGLQFITTEAEFNPSEPLRLPSGKMLRYSFFETEDPFTGRILFDLLYNHVDENVWIPVKELRDAGKISVHGGGIEDVDESGVPRMGEEVSSMLFTTYTDNDDSIVNINSFESYRVGLPDNPAEKVPALELLLDKWLPMPMFETDNAGHTLGLPYGWCRVKIRRLGPGSAKGSFRYHFTWAFDTTTSADPLSVYSPTFANQSGVDKKEFALCNRPDALFGFLSVAPDCNQISQYIATLLGINPDQIAHHRYKYLAYYIYLISFIGRVGAAPSVALYNPDPATDIPVDMVLDIGNSRTCGVLFEDGDFTKSVMLELRDLSRPWITYNEAFDMRLVFRRADFGNDLILPDDLFNWKSIVRIGREAKDLVYKSIEDPGLSERATNYSSPKRYLWDDKPSQERWEFLITETDPFNVSVDKNIFLKNFTDMFDERGRFISADRVADDSFSIFDMPDNSDCHYSRSSMMTFVMIEVLNQAISQINSPYYLSKHGARDLRRRLRRVIVTSPTAMPMTEQIALRRSMVNAIECLRRCNQHLAEIEVTPSPEALAARKDFDEFDDRAPRVWSYDEASACQMVYLYGELAERYENDVESFFNAKGHRRPEFEEEGYDRNSLTIGSIDIGAGTTDIMICSYKYEGEGTPRIVPVPHFYDSFYIAGDDILHAIVQRVVIDGPATGIPDMGSIKSALEARMLAMTDDELRNLPCNQAKFTDVYRRKIEDIVGTHSPERRAELIKYLCSILLRDFFGRDSAMMSFKDRVARVDFNTQISVPIAQMMMDLLRLKRPSRVYTYDEIFHSSKPSAHLLRHFAEHFGFAFEELSWRFEPDTIASIVRSTMEPLMKQLSILLHAYHCDILVLAGRPTSIEAIPDLFLKYYPLAPDRIIRLGDYRVGNWYPFADGNGYFYDQKSVVAVGAMIGNLAGSTGFNGLSIDFSRMIKEMHSTANYVGFFNAKTAQVRESILTPTRSNASATIALFPAYLGTKQFDSPLYQARPIYCVNLTGKATLPVRVTFTRSFRDDREKVEIDEATDAQGNTIPKSAIEIVAQSLVDDGKHWLDKGEFDLSL
ncbi:MAG: virulence factor SrfB [Muribaculaceae bacterium]|nr:virulence factor SrfB [Muribaculaceae bacterium]